MTTKSSFDASASKAFSSDIRELAEAVWRSHRTGECPVEAVPTAEQLDEVITADAWAVEAREEFSRRWNEVGRPDGRSYEVTSISELVHLSWIAARAEGIRVKHPLAPLIQAWQSRPLEVKPVRDTDGSLRADAVVPRIAIAKLGSIRNRQTLSTSSPLQSRGGADDFPQASRPRTRQDAFPCCPSIFMTLAWRRERQEAVAVRPRFPHVMLVKLAAAPSTTVRHGVRFVTYEITLRDLRDALYPPERLDGKNQEAACCGPSMATYQRSYQGHQSGRSDTDTRPNDRLRPLPPSRAGIREFWTN